MKISELSRPHIHNGMLTTTFVRGKLNRLRSAKVAVAKTGFANADSIKFVVVVLLNSTRTRRSSTSAYFQTAKVCYAKFVSPLQLADEW